MKEGRTAMDRNEIESPSHYTDGGIETIDYISAKGWAEGYCAGNIIKYVSRAGKKDPDKKLTDLYKARWYLDRLIREVEGG